MLLHSRCCWDIQGSSHRESIRGLVWSTLLLALCVSAIWQDGVLAEPVTAPIERETIIIPAGLDDWELAWHASKVNVHNLEWVTGGETVENWTQLFSVSRMLLDPAVTASKFAAFSLEMLSHGCPDLRYRLHHQSETDTSYEWIVVGCPRAEDQHELVRILRSGDYVFRVAYTRKGTQMPDEMHDHWLAVLSGVEQAHCCEADDKGLSSIPLVALYGSFDFNQTPEMRLWFEIEPHEELGKDMAVLKSLGFPQDHEYDVFMISLSPTRDWHAMPYAQGLVADEHGSLRCPQPTENRQTRDRPETKAGEAPTVEWERPTEEGVNGCERLPGALLSDFFRLVGVRLQAGLPMAAAVRSTDGSHATYAKFIRVPIEGKEGKCVVTLELVSNDARTYVAYGSDFPADQNIDIAWKYANNRQAQSVRTDSTGSFVAAINHPGEAAGPKKWQALLEASSSQCKVTVKYKWGEEGMKR